MFPRRDLHKLGMTRNDLFNVKHKIIAANRSPISIDGAMLLKFTESRSSDKSKQGPSASAMVYMSPDASDFYLSKLTLK